MKSLFAKRLNQILHYVQDDYLNTVILNEAKRNEESEFEILHFVQDDYRINVILRE